MMHPPIRRLAGVAVASLCAVLGACSSTGLVVESVNAYSARYGQGTDLVNSIANGDGFIRVMTAPGSEFHVTHRFTDALVWDTDFLERNGSDSANFDAPGTAIAYYTGHGLTTAYDGVPEQLCTSSTQCVTPPSGASLPGVCKAAGSANYAPGDVPRCVYYSDRVLAVNGSNDAFGGAVNYSNGGAAWGESSNAGGWRGVGTDGGANLVVLDASFGVLATYWVAQTRQAMAGAHLLATIMPVTGDTANVADRGQLFAGAWAQNADSAVALSWLTTMNSIAGSGINGGGCNFVIAYDATPQAAQRHIDETWRDLENDGLDARGSDFYVARWLCNWSSTITDQSIFELP